MTDDTLRERQRIQQIVPWCKSDDPLVDEILKYANQKVVAELEALSEYWQNALEPGAMDNKTDFYLKGVEQCQKRVDDRLKELKGRSE